MRIARNFSISSTVRILSMPGIFIFVGLVLFWLPAVSAKIITQTVEYKDAQGTQLEGYVVYDDKISGPHPGVIVVHDWRGLTDYTHRRATMLAELGYVAFAADIYGKGVRLKTVPEWLKEIAIFKGDRGLFRQRERAAYQAFLNVPEVDVTRIAAIGYCFGGTGVIEMARDGLDLKGVVSFHGGLDGDPIPPGKSIKTKILALCGADDPYETSADFSAFEDQLRQNQVDYQIVKYGHAMHAFSDPDVDALNQPGAKYNAAADVRSWRAMKDFLEEVFATSIK
jgi:dienelactone hydrolase